MSIAKEEELIIDLKTFFFLHSNKQNDDSSDLYGEWDASDLQAVTVASNLSLESTAGVQRPTTTKYIKIHFIRLKFKSDAF